jgi:mannose-6-phosphate isomerase-like protein (cupin superfamily)
MTVEKIIEMAINYTTIGLRGADSFEFEVWKESAPENELTVFREIADLIHEISEQSIVPIEPDKSVKSRIMKSIRNSEKSRTQASNESQPMTSVPGFKFTDSHQGTWRELPCGGARIKELSTTSQVSMFLLEMDPGARLPPHHHEGVEEGFLISGDLQMSGKKIEVGGYMRAESGSQHPEVYSEEGCRALMVTSRDNYPRKAIHVYDRLSRALRRAKKLVSPE